MLQPKKLHPEPKPPTGSAVEIVSAKHAKPGEVSYVARLGLKITSMPTLHREIERGIPFTAVRRMQECYAFSFAEIAEALRVSPRTLERRKEEGRLDPLESDRALRLSRVYTKAVELYEGNQEEALAWLKRKNRALGGMVPVDLIKTETGALQVEHLIGRLEYGVYS